MSIFRNIINDLKINAICYNNGISDDKDAILFSDIHEVTCGGKKGIEFFDIPNPTIGSIDSLIGSLRHLRKDHRHKCQVEYMDLMFIDPVFRREKYKIYKSEILPLIDKCTFRDIIRYYFRSKPQKIDKTATSPQ